MQLDRRRAQSATRWKRIVETLNRIEAAALAAGSDFERVRSGLLLVRLTSRTSVALARESIVVAVCDIFISFLKPVR